MYYYIIDQQITKFNAHVVTIKFNSIWHGVPKHYEVCQLVNSVVTSSVKNVAWSHFPIFFLFFNKSRITSGRIKNKQEKMFTTPQNERWLYQEIRGGIAKKSGSKRVKYPKVHLTVSIKK